MKLSLKAFPQLIEDMSAALQSSAVGLVDVSVGSVMRALFEANASVALWMQWLILQLLQVTRAATSTGADLDSWMADFGVSRLPAIPSTGEVVFSRFAADLPASIPVGAVVKTTDGSLSFSVAADTSSSIWQASTSSYVLPAGVTSATLPVTCNVAGQGGNVLANTLTVIATSLPGVDQVTNPAPLSNGLDAEPDNMLRQRFVGYLASLSCATKGAITSAIAGVRQGLSLSLLENTAADGSPQPGSFLAVIDDGTGFPSSELLALVASAIEPVRPVGTSYAVCAPSVVIVNVAVSIVLTSGSTPADVQSTVQNAVQDYLGSLPIGRTCSATRIAQAIYAGSPSVDNVGAVLLNGAAADIVPRVTGVIKPGTIAVTVNGT